MSLVFLKNKDNSRKGLNKMEAYRFSNYLTQPLKLPPNSQVALINTSFNLTNEVVLDNEMPIFARYGIEPLNSNFKIDLPDDRHVFNWTEFFNDLGMSISSLLGDNAITPIYAQSNIIQPPQNPTPPLNPKSRVQFKTPKNGLNWVLQNDKTSLLQLRQTADTIPDSYFSFFTPIYRPPTQPDWTVGPHTYTVGSKINAQDFPNGDVNKHVYEAVGDILFVTADDTGALTRYGSVDVVMGEPKSTTNEWNHLYTTHNWYNTHFNYNDSLENSQFLSGTTTENLSPTFTGEISTSIVTYDTQYNQEVPINPLAKEWAFSGSTVGIMKSIGDQTPAEADNGIADGHRFIGHKESGGYVVFAWECRHFDDANIMYPASWFGSSDHTGSAGFAPKFTGVLPTAMYLDGDQETSRQDNLESAELHCQLVDLNAGRVQRPVNLVGQPQGGRGVNEFDANGGRARYLFGVRYGTNRFRGERMSIFAQVLLPGHEGGSLGESAYVNVGRGIDFLQLCQGRNTASVGNNGSIVFEPNFAINQVPGPRHINVVGRFGAQSDPVLYFRFRYDTPYTMVCEFTLSELVNYPNSYNPSTDSPYIPYDDPSHAMKDDEGYNMNPLAGWCLLGRMKNPFIAGTPNARVDKTFFIPHHLGDLGLVDYEIYSKSFCGYKGFFSNVMSGIEQISTGGVQTLAEFRNRAFFKGLEDVTPDGYDGQGTLVINPNSTDQTSAVFLQRNAHGGVSGNFEYTLNDINSEGYDSTGRMKKDFELLLTHTQAPEDIDHWIHSNGTFWFKKVGEPVGLNHGLTWGLQEVGNEVESTIGLDENGTSTPFELLTYEGPNPYINGDGVYSNHIQIANLPIQSQNGVRSTQNKTIYVIPVYTDQTHQLQQNSQTLNSYSFTVPQLVWIDLNNYEEINLNKIDILITNDDNTEQKALAGNTDLTLMFRQKGAGDAGYLPINQPAEYVVARERVKRETIGGLVDKGY